MIKSEDQKYFRIILEKITAIFRLITLKDQLKLMVMMTIQVSIQPNLIYKNNQFIKK